MKKYAFILFMAISATFTNVHCVDSDNDSITKTEISGSGCAPRVTRYNGDGSENSGTTESGSKDSSIAP